MSATVRHHPKEDHLAQQPAIDQPSLEGLLLEPSGSLRVWDDYGEVGRGASKAHYVLAENGEEYIVKGPTLTPEHRYVAANELIAARLAEALGLPILDYRVLILDEVLYFGSSWMQKPTFYPAITADLFIGRP